MFRNARTRSRVLAWPCHQCCVGCHLCKCTYQYDRMQYYCIAWYRIFSISNDVPW